MIERNGTMVAGAPQSGNVYTARTSRGPPGPSVRADRASARADRAPERTERL